MKKIVSMVVAVMIITTLTAVPVYAKHGSHHGGTQRVQRTQYAVCDTLDCVKLGLHIHNGTIYSAHCYGDGHDYHDYCDIDGCTLTGYHEHDGVYCFAFSAYDSCHTTRSWHH